MSIHSPDVQFSILYQHFGPRSCAANICCSINPNPDGYPNIRLAELAEAYRCWFALLVLARPLIVYFLLNPGIADIYITVGIYRHRHCMSFTWSSLSAICRCMHRLCHILLYPMCIPTTLQGHSPLPCTIPKRRARRQTEQNFQFCWWPPLAVLNTTRDWGSTKIPFHPQTGRVWMQDPPGPYQSSKCNILTPNDDGAKQCFV